MRYMANNCPILGLIWDFSCSEQEPAKNFDRYVSEGLLVDPSDPQDPVYVIFGLFWHFLSNLDSYILVNL